MPSLDAFFQGLARGPMPPISAGTSWGDAAQNLAGENLANFHPFHVDVASIANALPGYLAHGPLPTPPPPPGGGNGGNGGNGGFSGGGDNGGGGAGSTGGIFDHPIEISGARGGRMNRADGGGDVKASRQHEMPDIQNRQDEQHVAFRDRQGHDMYSGPYDSKPDPQWPLMKAHQLPELLREGIIGTLNMEAPFPGQRSGSLPPVSTTPGGLPAPALGYSRGRAPGGPVVQGTGSAAPPLEGHYGNFDEYEDEHGVLRLRSHDDWATNLSRMKQGVPEYDMHEPPKGMPWEKDIEQGAEPNQRAYKPSTGIESIGGNPLTPIAPINPWADEFKEYGGPRKSRSYRKGGIVSAALRIARGKKK
jgi:hypothetical protein